MKMILDWGIASWPGVYDRFWLKIVLSDEPHFYWRWHGSARNTAFDVTVSHSENNLVWAFFIMIMPGCFTVPFKVVDAHPATPLLFADWRRFLTERTVFA